MAQNPGNAVRSGVIMGIKCVGAQAISWLLVTLSVVIPKTYPSQRNRQETIPATLLRSQPGAEAG